MEDLIKKVNELHEMVNKLLVRSTPKFMDNSDFIQFMNISKRTAQSWRDNKIIPYSQIGNKIYYRMEDINELLTKNYIK